MAVLLAKNVRRRTPASGPVRELEARVDPVALAVLPALAEKLVPVVERLEPVVERLEPVALLVQVERPARVARVDPRSSMLKITRPKATVSCVRQAPRSAMVPKRAGSRVSSLSVLSL